MRIGQLTDLHLLEHAVHRRRGVARLQVEYLSLKRAVNPLDRIDRVARSLATARNANLDHLVITGDLTEDGTPEQYALLRELLDASGLEPEQVTLLAGNHDEYGMSWREALQHPLDRWATNATPGAPVDVGAAVIVPLNSAVSQPFWKSCGRVPADQLVAAAEVAGAGRPLVLAQHHPPYRIRHHWVHGLQNCEDVAALLAAFPEAHLIYGHLHTRRDLALPGEERVRIFGACAVAESDAPLRVYALEDSALSAESEAAAAA